MGLYKYVVLCSEHQKDKGMNRKVAKELGLSRQAVS